MPRKILTLKILKMNANELRIGNYVLLASKTLYQVDILYKDYVSLNYWQAIPLTEEWLLKLGFNEIKNEPRKWFRIKTKKQGVYLEVSIKEKRVILFKDKGGCYSDFIFPKYVHQLQNLYFALTQTELTAN